ncbi:hypothetical protein ABE65_016220 [Fictibacillus phosphorivorans]|uniref:Reverse transcriptase domain-containing protein n=1 Tax=Fictibacillus phosphorivorans TaxID=1221500 RepID=A0A160IPC9_9BACL|nr:RNA-directed DNA polymerase [Fictibacillus phosphorivorans]ANC78261.1 hypothetical protein ABE65_016220 [Fictibacillus phosphorivorans]
MSFKRKVLNIEKLKKIINKNMYNKYFSLKYLIKYGYFDFKYSKGDKDENYILSNLLYKKVFNTDELLMFIEEIQNNIGFKGKETTPIEISIYKNEDERRHFKLPNIYSYISLSIHLNKYKDTYIDILSSSNKSLSNKFYSSTFFKDKVKREENRIGKKHIFKTDIQNFYPSLYTHSIPWILVGKTIAKSNKTNKNEYYNQLDTSIQNCQRGETHGLPTGTFASRLIAEIYMCKFDNIMNKYDYIRYVDDFELPYNDESFKSEFYKDLNKELNNLNLKIKVEKNQVDTFPFQGDNNSAFFFDYFTNQDKNIKNQSKRIYHFIDKCIYKEREGYKGSLKLMFKALKKSILKKNLSQDSFTKLILKKLFNLVLMTPHLSVYFMEFIEKLNLNIIENNLISSIEEIKPQIQMNINRYIELNYNQELYSLLSIFYYLNLYSISDKDILLQIIGNMDDLSSILAFELLIYDENNIDRTLFETIEEKLVNSISWEDEYWLFKYHFFLKINENKKSKNYKVFKEHMYLKYGTGIDKSKFFNQKNMKQVQSPINLLFQQKNSNPDISNFYKFLIDKKINFLKKNLLRN